MNDLKNIHIGEYIRNRVEEQKISISRILNFLKTTEDEINKVYQQQSLDTETLLRWSKLLKYDFFRLYTQHLILFTPQDNVNYNHSASSAPKSSLPRFRKNIYTRTLINYILDLINTNQKTKLEIIEEYRIPKTTLYKWVAKYNNSQ